MEQLGVIEPSESPLGSPSYLGQEKGWNTAILYRLPQAEGGHTEGQLSYFVKYAKYSFIYRDDLFNKNQNINRDKRPSYFEYSILCKLDRLT